MPYRYILISIIIITAPSLSGQTRSFDALFPGYDESAKAAVFTPKGIFKSTERSGESSPVPQMLPVFLSGNDFADPVLRMEPSFLVESLMVIPLTGYYGGLTGIYNAFGNISGLKGRLYHSVTRDREVPLFEDAARLESAKKTSPIPDPPPVRVMPPQETIFMRLKDSNFGNSYYRADITAAQRGLLFRLSNFRNITYLLIPVIRENKFIAQLYIEPLLEGILIYCIAGADVSDFVASRIDMSSAIQKRLAVFMEWIIDGIDKTPSP
ncbi:MAG: hypothetical protein LBQ38_03795 [Spirochaetaceae bacterium]|jgi:hypothetical protein|nr:hypothetical protein [Spirochaetaceae bacterium]